MTKVLQQAMAAAARLPEDEQDRIGREVLAHVERVSSLCEELDKGLSSLGAGKGRELDIEAVIARARKAHGER
jgi:hypothetical protein